MGRWYYLNKQQKVFVSKCIPGGEALSHQYKLVGYEHIDTKKISYPIYKIWIETGNGSLVLKERESRPDRGQYAYVLIREETIPYKTPRLEGRIFVTPLAVFHVYTRQDGSEYRILTRDAGEKREELPLSQAPAAPIAAPQVVAPQAAPQPPQEVTERRNAFEYTIDSFSFDRKQYKCTHVEVSDNAAPQFHRPSPCVSDPADVFGHKEHNCFIYKRPCVQTRKKIIAPNGHATVTPWAVESVSKNYAPYCYIMGGGAYYNTHPSAYPGGSPHVPAQPNRIN
jgi:hypothetical protein